MDSDALAWLLTGASGLVQKGAWLLGWSEDREGRREAHGLRGSPCKAPELTFQIPNSAFLSQ